MNRAKTLEDIEKEWYWIDTEIGKGKGVPLGAVRHKINEIFDGFENRTCNNCKHFTTPQYGYSVCKEIGNVTVPKDFGCNKFKLEQTNCTKQNT